jgi:hypothetical protein
MSKGRAKKGTCKTAHQSICLGGCQQQHIYIVLGHHGSSRARPSTTRTMALLSLPISTWRQLCGASGGTSRFRTVSCHTEYGIYKEVQSCCRSRTREDSLSMRNFGIRLTRFVGGGGKRRLKLHRDNTSMSCISLDRGEAVTVSTTRMEEEISICVQVNSHLAHTTPL